MSKLTIPISNIVSGDWNSVVNFSKDVQKSISKLSSFKLGPTASPTFSALTISALTLTGFSGILQATAGVVSDNAPINALANATANKTFNNGEFSLSFNFTNPTNQPTYDGAFEIQVSGAFAGDLFHVHQHTGNPGVTDLCHFEASDNNVTVLRLQHDGTGNVLEVGASDSVVASINQAGAGVLTGLTITGISGVLKATDGVISGSANHDDLGTITANQHHNQAHTLDGSDHTVTGLTTGHVLTATSATTFAFQETAGGVTVVVDATERLALTPDPGDLVYEEETGDLYLYTSAL